MAKFISILVAVLLSYTVVQAELPALASGKWHLMHLKKIKLFS
jgi:hypothetical protein